MKKYQEFLNRFPTISILISSRLDGNMSTSYGDEVAVLENRTKYFIAHGIPVERTVKMNVLHSDEIMKILSSNSEYSIPDSNISTDAVITNIRGLYFYVLFGDCIPLFLFNPDMTIMAYAHMSWKSICKYLHSKVAFEVTKIANCKFDDLIIVLGPSIKAESYCFTNPAQLEMPEWANYVKKNSNEMFCIDLVKFIVDDLLKLGIKPSNVYCSDIDTGVDMRYFSHFRAVNNFDPSDSEGRFIVAAGIK